MIHKQDNGADGEDQRHCFRASSSVLRQLSHRDYRRDAVAFRVCVPGIKLSITQTALLLLSAMKARFPSGWKLAQPA